MNKKLQLELIHDVISKHYGIEFLVNSRKRELSDKKKLFAYIARMRGISTNDIANYAGWENHASACYAIKSFSELMKFYKQFEDDYNIINLFIDDEIELRKCIGLL